MKLLYLHGMRSSPNSAKARLCLERVERLRHGGDRIEWCCPQLPASPKAAMAMVMDLIADWQGHQMAVIGSSLGGFYAHYVAEQKRCGAVLLNPVVSPADLLARHLEAGDSEVIGDSEYCQPAFIDELRALEVPLTMPERYFVILEKGDEVLDWHEASRYYRKCEHKVIEGGDHALTDFADHLDEVFYFIGLGD